MRHSPRPAASAAANGADDGFARLQFAGILAAGYGARIRSLFLDTPKALIEVGGHTLIDHLIDNLYRSRAVESITVVTNDRYLPDPQRHVATAMRCQHAVPCRPRG